MIPCQGNIFLFRSSLYDPTALTPTPHGYGETYFQSFSIEVSQPCDPIDSRIRIWRLFPDAIKGIVLVLHFTQR